MIALARLVEPLLAHAGHASHRQAIAAMALATGVLLWSAIRTRPTTDRSPTDPSARPDGDE